MESFAISGAHSSSSKEEGHPYDIRKRTAADQILRELQNNLDMWLQVFHILQKSENLNTKFFALQLTSNGLLGEGDTWQERRSKFNFFSFILKMGHRVFRLLTLFLFFFFLFE